MKYTNIIMLLASCISPLFGMTMTDTLIPYRLNDKWGFADRHGIIKITPKYDSVRRFHAEFAVVGIDNRFGFVNTSGEEVITLKYSTVTDFDSINRMIKVTLEGKYQVINEKGKRIRGKTSWTVPRIYDCVSHGWDYSGAIYEENGLYGFIEQLCNSPDVDSCKKYGELEFNAYVGFGVYRAAVKKGDKWAIVGFRSTGYYISSFEYDQVFADPDNPFAQHTLTIVAKDGMFGYISSKGEPVIPPKYDGAEFFKNGLAQVSLGGNWGYIDHTGVEYFHDNQTTHNTGQTPSSRNSVSLKLTKK